MLLVDIMDLVGTAAFAASGAFVAIKNKLDLFGVFVLSIITACGGGIIRDVIISKDPPVFFTQPKYITLITLIALVTCLAFKHVKKLLFIIQICDAIGLGVFTVLAAYKGIQLQLPIIGVLFVAVLTGVGGGIVRDMFVNKVPLVFKSEIYAMASMLGALVFYGFYGKLDTNFNIYMCIMIIFAIRMAAIHFGLNLPVVKTEKVNL